MLIGYARVSTNEQDASGQMCALEFGIHPATVSRLLQQALELARRVRRRKKAFLTL
jgi:hypothetical protein